MNDMREGDIIEQSSRSKEQDKDGMETLRGELRSISSAISHDLQAPVRRIIGLSQIISEDHAEGLDDVGKKYLDIIASEGIRMDGMIQDLLTWSRAAVCECNKREVDLSKIVNAIISDEKEKENAPEIEATVDDHVTVEADPDMIEMLMRELIDNSIKFAHEGTVRNIKFGKERTEGGDIIFLKDNGVGFDRSRSQRMFDPFKRMHGNEFPGEGMGLAIARLIVKRHGGRIWAESAPENGSTFFISLE
ncbi:MAG: hypothetical protein LLG16_04440 [Euryarchaeota archaeon]|nr:hypothetical protein [Euryarchaeota archaeon]